MGLIHVFFLLYVIFGTPVSSVRSSHDVGKVGKAHSVDPSQDPNPNLKGYLTVDDEGSELYYAYWEAEGSSKQASTTPIALWLQGGPGCASTFGGFFELGPYMLNAKLELVKNPGSWARTNGLLLLDQPLGTGYSQPARNASIPTDELGMAFHLYAALQAFFSLHQDLASRPLFITGESYAGKYIPSIAHYILQAQDMAETPSSSAASSPAGRPSRASSLRKAPRGSGTEALLPRSGGALLQWRRLPEGIAAPVFHLAGVAIGNGLTDPRTQVQTMADAAYFQGLLTPALHRQIQDGQQEVVSLIDARQWAEAHTRRETLREMITNVTGLATMFDTRRELDYDSDHRVDRFLNLPDVKRAMGAHKEVIYTSCSDTVGSSMAADTMQTVKHLLPDVLDRLPVLLYQGQFDILDGVASCTSWINTLQWPYQQQLADDPGNLWTVGDRVAGWQRQAGHLTHAVVYKAGHMVPHDQPEAAQAMLHNWMSSALSAALRGEV